MGAAKQKMLEDMTRSYNRNRYYHARQKLLNRIRLYAHWPNFVAKLKDELETLERNWKVRPR